MEHIKETNSTSKFTLLVAVDVVLKMRNATMFGKEKVDFNALPLRINQTYVRFDMSSKANQVKGLPPPMQ